MILWIGGFVPMEFGSVLPKGDTVGQGLSTGSFVALTSPIVIVGILLGAKAGLASLLSSPRRALLGWCS